MPASFSESVVEQAALARLESIGWTARNGAEIAPLPDRQAGDMPAAERANGRPQTLRSAGP